MVFLYKILSSTRTNLLQLQSQNVGLTSLTEFSINSHTSESSLNNSWNEIINVLPDMCLIEVLVVSISIIHCLPRLHNPSKHMFVYCSFFQNNKEAVLVCIATNLSLSDLLAIGNGSQCYKAIFVSLKVFLCALHELLIRITIYIVYV